MRGNAFIMVSCDGCGDEVEIELTATAGGGYDERYVDQHLRAQGWTTDGDKEYCPDCAANRKDV